MGNIFPIETLFVVSIWWGGEGRDNGMYEYHAQDSPLQKQRIICPKHVNSAKIENPCWI